MAKILLLNGPNVNLVGLIHPDLFGKITLPEIEARLKQQAAAAGHELIALHSNSEETLLNCLQDNLKNKLDFLIFNPGGLAYSSVSLRDALVAVELPFVEVHLSNIFAREGFRAHSYFSDIAVGVIVGLADHSYDLALNYAIARLR